MLVFLLRMPKAKRYLLIIQLKFVSLHQRSVWYLRKKNILVHYVAMVVKTMLESGHAPPTHRLFHP